MLVTRKALVDLDRNERRRIQMTGLKHVVVGEFTSQGVEACNLQHIERKKKN
jgi:hypothetical protein